MDYLIFSGITGMTLPYEIYGCDVYGNNCVLITTLNQPPPVILTLPPIFSTYSSILLKVSNCVNCDYEELLYCV